MEICLRIPLKISKKKKKTPNTALFFVMCTALPWLGDVVVMLALVSLQDQAQVCINP